MQLHTLVPACHIPHPSRRDNCQKSKILHNYFDSPHKITRFKCQQSVGMPPFQSFLRYCHKWHQMMVRWHAWNAIVENDLDNGNNIDMSCIMRSICFAGIYESLCHYAEKSGSSLYREVQYYNIYVCHPLFLFLEIALPNSIKLPAACLWYEHRCHRPYPVLYPATRNMMTSLLGR